MSIFNPLPDVAESWDFHLVTSLPAMTSGDRFCFSGIGGGGWMHPKGADSMAVSGLCFENTLVGSEWATAVLLCKNGLKNSLLPCTAPISNGEAFIPVWASSCRLSAVTIPSSLMGGCGLSYKCVEDGCKSTCVEFGGWNLTELRIW